MTTFELSEPITAPVPVIPSSTETQRHLLPSWLKSFDEFRAAAMWQTKRQLRRGLFHFLRSPKYGARYAWWSLRGAGITTWALISGIWGAEKREHLKTSRHEFTFREYWRLVRSLWKFRVFGTLGLGVAATLGVGGDVLLTTLAPWWIDTPINLALFVGAGCIGRPIGAPMVPIAAILPAKFDKVTPDRICEALVAIGVGITDVDDVEVITDLTRDHVNQLQYCELRLPAGVIAEKVIRKRKQLAGALPGDRNIGSVWPEKGSKGENSLRLVLTDHDLTDLPQKPSPLLGVKSTNCFDPIHVGFDESGHSTTIPGAGNGHIFAAAATGGGKSTFARNVVAHFALDPIADIIAMDPKGSGEFASFNSVARFNLADRDDMGQMIRCLEWVDDNLSLRSRLIKQLPEGMKREVTREVAEMIPELRPMLVKIEECNRLLFHPEHGPEARRLVASIADQGRSLGVTLLLLTQRGVSSHMPSEIKVNMGTRWAGRLADQVEVDGVLGTGAFGNGALCNEIPQGTGFGYIGSESGGFEAMRATNLTPQEQRQIVDTALMQRGGSVEQLQFPEPGPELELGEQGSLLQRLLELQTADGYDPKGIWSKDFHYVCEDFKVSDVQLRKALKEAGVAVKGVEMYDVDKGKVTTKQGFRFDELAKALGE